MLLLCPLYIFLVCFQCFVSWFPSLVYVLFPLQCKCCQLEDPSSLVTSLPDISVAYKLHLECGRLIHLYDWLQAFVSVVGQEDEEDEEVSSASSKKIDPKLQYPLSLLFWLSLLYHWLICDNLSCLVSLLFLLQLI